MAASASTSCPSEVSGAAVAATLSPPRGSAFACSVGRGILSRPLNRTRGSVRAVGTVAAAAAADETLLPTQGARRCVAWVAVRGSPPRRRRCACGVPQHSDVATTRYVTCGTLRRQVKPDEAQRLLSRPHSFAWRAVATTSTCLLTCYDASSFSCAPSVVPSARGSGGCSPLPRRKPPRVGWGSHQGITPPPANPRPTPSPLRHYIRQSASVTSTPMSPPQLPTPPPPPAPPSPVPRQWTQIHQRRPAGAPLPPPTRTTRAARRPAVSRRLHRTGAGGPAARCLLIQPRPGTAAKFPLLHRRPQACGGPVRGRPGRARRGPPRRGWRRPCRDAPRAPPPPIAAAPARGPARQR